MNFLNLQMGLASLHHTTFCSKAFSNSHSINPLISQPRNSCKPSLNLKPQNKILPRTSYASRITCSSLSRQSLIQSSLYLRHEGLSLVAFGTKNSRSAEEDHRALETVNKLYAAIKNRNISEMSDIISEECRCVCNFTSIFQPFHGKKQVLDFFSSLMRSLGNNIEFVVQPIWDDGVNVGVSWKLEWKNTCVPLGKGFSFYVVHVYHGKLVIRNVEMFIEPLLHVEPLRLKILAFVLTAIDKMGSKAELRGEVKRAVYTLLTLLFMAVSLFFLKHSLY